MNRNFTLTTALIACISVAAVSPAALHADAAAVTQAPAAAVAAADETSAAAAVTADGTAIAATPMEIDGTGASAPAMDLAQAAATVEAAFAQINSVLVAAANQTIALQAEAEKAKAEGREDAAQRQKEADAAASQFRILQEEVTKVLSDNGVDVSTFVAYQQLVALAAQQNAKEGTDAGESGKVAEPEAPKAEEKDSQPSAEEIYAQLEAHIVEASKNGITQEYVTVLQPSDYTSYNMSSVPLKKELGVVYGPSGKETWYNLDMSKNVERLNSMGYPGKYWIRADGVKMCGDYVMCAASYLVHPFGSLVETSLGTAIVADTGGFAVTEPNMIDIATNWVLDSE